MGQTFQPRAAFDWKLRTRSLRLGERTVLMGILNVTPDSFSDGGRYLDVHAAVAHGLRLLDEGAEILDIGGESTRPGATALTTEEEQARVLPVLAALLQARPDAILSVDTYHAATARAAVAVGAEIINDVSGLMWDQGMAAALAETRPGSVLMHARGRPGEWAGLPRLRPGEVLPLVLGGLRESLDVAATTGIASETIAIDPGFGFGKIGDENLAVHAALGNLHTLGRPLLVGTSRKRFLGGGVHGSVASGVAAILAGAHILRVHDVAATREAVSLADGILRTAMQ